MRKTMKTITLLLAAVLAAPPVAAQDTSRNFIRVRRAMNTQTSVFQTGVTYYDGLGREPLSATDGATDGGTFAYHRDGEIDTLPDDE